MLYFAGLLAAALAAVHLFVGRLRFLDVVPRSRWLSGAGGVAIAYVFLHILPELSTHDETFAKALGTDAVAAEMHVYLVALIGLVTFYGLERVAKVSRYRSRRRGGEDAVEPEAFWLHIGSFAVYNALIGYLLLHREETGLWSLTTFFLAMALHFVTNDFGLRQDHKASYDRIGRWILSGAVIAGWALGILISVPEIAIGLLFAFLAGGVVLNVVKEELPEERQSRFWPFLVGAAGYAVLLIAG